MNANSLIVRPRCGIRILPNIVYDYSCVPDELLVTNQSNLDLNVTLSTKEPFYLITPKKKRVQTMKLVLVDKISTKITVFFSFDTKTKNFYSKIYEEVLLFEYREHPNRVNFTFFTKL